MAADRIEGWAAASGGRLQIVRSRADLDAVVSPDGAAASPAGRRDRPVGAFIGVQGGHNLEGRPENLAVLHARGVRMMALAHVMDNALAGSGTGRGGGGLGPMGRDVIGEMERVGMVVDLEGPDMRLSRMGSSGQGIGPRPQGPRRAP